MESKQNASGKMAADGILPSDYEERESKFVSHDVQQAQHAEATPPILDRRLDARYQELGTSSENESLRCEGDEEEPPEPRSFKRSMSPTTMQRNKNACYEKVGEEGVNNMHRFTLYETTTRFYLVGQDIMEKHFRVLKIDRTAPPGHLNVFEGDIVYDRREMSQLLNAIEDGNKGAGGMKLKCSTWGLLGFIRFTESYYMLLITKRTQIALIGGHYIYQIEATELIPLTTGSSTRFTKDRNPEEIRYLNILANLDLTKSFYFSYSYNVTRTLQRNIVRERMAINQGLRHSSQDFNDMFVWNHYLLEPAMNALKNPYDWCVPVIHGFIEQASLDVFSRRVYITVIARRSRFFAGARFLKRGANDLGYVANDVETEQIVCDKLTTSFHAPGPELYCSPQYTSYVQHRGSIPLYWTQDNSGVTPKPDIDINLIDPFYGAAALHFDNLFERYGTPVYVLNLIKARERTPRESKLLVEYQKAISFLNQSLPPDKKILYKTYDMSRAAKTHGQDVIGTLEIIAEEILEKTGFFHNGDSSDRASSVQNGVARTNCIDCLDRTNAAQFVIGKRALGRQLQALGIIKEEVVGYDTDAVNIFTHIFHSHGDNIAIQYGGSHLVNTMSTYRKINEWRSHSRDMVESFKRYYHNSFLDAQRQEAYNLFLGNYIYAQGQPMLWDLQSDYYLHHSDPRSYGVHKPRDYINWYTPEFLEPRELPSVKGPEREALAKGVSYFDDYWVEYYRPLAISSFAKTFSWKISPRPRYLSDGSLQQGPWNPSPFVPRRPPLTEQPDSPGKKPRKGVTIVDPHSDDCLRVKVAQPNGESPQSKPSILRDSQFESPEKTPSTPAIFTPADKSLMTQWTLNQFYQNSLNPYVSSSETQEYDRYISHPLNLPLVVSTEQPDDVANLDYIKYVNNMSGEPVGYHQFDDVKDWEISEYDLAGFHDFLTVAENPLTVTEEDGEKKRYKAYRQWLKGKSIFKQSKVDPEYKAN
jgi:hypothetical protein